MKTSSFSFDLPPGLIAAHPPEQRGSSRLMTLERYTGKIGHQTIPSLKELLSPGTLLVINDTRVRKARMPGENMDTGGKGEFLFLQQTAEGLWECLVDKAKKRRKGQRWRFPGGVEGTITALPSEDRRILTLRPPPGEDWFERWGHVPLPPYLKREDTPQDEDHYQTVYADKPGSAAAPTAGLHLTSKLLGDLESGGIEIVRLTLHVGLGTFVPVRTENIQDHVMHGEKYHIPLETAQAVNRAKKEGRPVLGVGTTSVRTLETAWSEGSLQAGAGESKLFIYPGYQFQVVDQILTNFHTPGSTLLMMISAFAGQQRLLAAYQQAVEQGYRFFSYGDAMLIR